jgi:hypothetical protein
MVLPLPFAGGVLVCEERILVPPQGGITGNNRRRDD